MTTALTFELIAKANELLEIYVYIHLRIMWYNILNEICLHIFKISQISAIENFGI
jgi:hypothetical protein